MAPQGLAASAALSKGAGPLPADFARSPGLAIWQAPAIKNRVIMNAIPTDLHDPASGIGAGSNDLALRWGALQDAANAVALLAGIAAQPSSDTESHFPDRAMAAGGWRLALAESGVDDLSAIMQPGLAALLAASANGQNASAAAQALWHEFRTASEALARIVPDLSAADAPKPE